MGFDGYTKGIFSTFHKVTASTAMGMDFHTAGEARRVNSGGGVYPDEVDEITAKLTEASGLFGSILEQLSKIQ